MPPGGAAPHLQVPPSWPNPQYCSPPSSPAFSSRPHPQESSLLAGSVPPPASAPPTNGPQPAAHQPTSGWEWDPGHPFQAGSAPQPHPRCSAPSRGPCTAGRPGLSPEVTPNLESCGSAHRDRFTLRLRPQRSSSYSGLVPRPRSWRCPRPHPLSDLTCRPSSSAMPSSVESGGAPAGVAVLQASCASLKSRAGE